MSAAGPSGMRPEHLREMVAVRDKRCAQTLLGSLVKFVGAATQGNLPEAARWILDSRLVFLAKKNGPAPRPIRVGELWRRLVAKRLVDDNRKKVQQLCKAARQFGVAMPGGAEGLVHFRIQLEKFLRLSGSAFAVVDVDFKNAYPSLEWDSIREAVEEDLPEIAPWTRWCHASAGRVVLPCGTSIWIDRGAEQGNPLGPIYCALTLARMMSKVRATLQQGGVGFFDAWFMDDGQLVCQPDVADRLLRVIDAEAARIGASRATGVEAKSVARLVGAEEAVTLTGSDWKTDYIKSSTTEAPSKQQHVLGVDFGPTHSVGQQFSHATKAVAGLHDALASTGDTASELVLLRQCADVCKVVHLLRAAGATLDPEELGAYDDMLEGSLIRCLGGELDCFSLDQAAMGER